jgi:uncharacterized protein
LQVAECGYSFIGTSMQNYPDYWIEKFELTEHPEGGYFAPAYRSGEQLKRECLPNRFPGDRATVSSIYYLLKKGQFSAFHRLKSVEIWNFYEGSPLVLHVLDEGGNLLLRKLGRNIENGEFPQTVVEPGSWFGAAIDGPGEFCLVGCTVVPGFDYEDFEIADRKELLARYPHHREIIERLTRNG